MPPLRPWVQCFNGEARAVAQMLSASLAAQSFEPTEVQPGMGLLVFAHQSEELLERIAALTRGDGQRVVAVAADGAGVPPDFAWRLVQAGAEDVVVWRDRADALGQITARLKRWQAVDDLLQSPLVTDQLVGRNANWTSVLRRIVEVARFTSDSMLVLGESGTGKELIARLVHALDQRKGKSDLVVVDCTTIVPELAGSEFFGHERGAFTGAVAARDGAFRLANGGTLFLDEVGELPRSLQAQLLRVVQEHTYKRVGGDTWHETRFRLVCATNRDLAEEVQRGRFRADLYYRISDWTFRLPSLRERIEDVPLLADFFAAKADPLAARPKMDAAVRELLLTREYPGNVRDLKQVISRMVHRHVGGGTLSVGDVAEDDRPATAAALRPWFDGPFESAIRRGLAHGAGMREIRQAAEEAAIRLAMEQADTLQDAARRLRISERALQLRRANQRRDAQEDGEDAAPQ